MTATNEITNEIIHANNHANIQAADEFMTTLINNFNGMLWADIFALEEERQEMERAIIFQEKLAERRRLYALGQYELEEGEILE